MLPCKPDERLASRILAASPFPPCVFLTGRAQTLDPCGGAVRCTKACGRERVDAPGRVCVCVWGGIMAERSKQHASDENSGSQN